MNFFTGYLLGQMNSGQARPGDAGAGMLTLFAVGISIIAFAGLLISLALPFYSVFLAAAFMEEAQFANEFRYPLILIFLSLIWVTYVVAVFGSRWAFVLGVTSFALINVATVLASDSCKTCILNAFMKTMSAAEKSSFSVISPLLMLLGMSIVRWTVSKLKTKEDRNKAIRFLLAPMIFASKSKWILWPATACTIVLSVGSWLRLQEVNNHIDRIKAETGLSHDDAFNLGTNASTYIEYLIVALGATVVASCLLVLCFASNANGKNRGRIRITT